MLSNLLSFTAGFVMGIVVMVLGSLIYQAGNRPPFPPSRQGRQSNVIGQDVISRMERLRKLRKPRT